MRIVNLEDFRAMPFGTIFSKYAPCCFDGLMVKKEVLENDFYYQDLIGNVKGGSFEDFSSKCTGAEKGDSLSLDFDCWERDGLYEKEQLYAVYEIEDVEKIIEVFFESKRLLIRGEKP